MIFCNKNFYIFCQFAVVRWSVSCALLQMWLSLNPGWLPNTKPGISSLRKSILPASSYLQSSSKEEYNEDLLRL